MKICVELDEPLRRQRQFGHALFSIKDVNPKLITKIQFLFLPASLAVLASLGSRLPGFRVVTIFSQNYN